MEFLKEIFGGKALTYDELKAALEGREDIELINGAGGEYVLKAEYDENKRRLKEAQEGAAALSQRLKEFEGTDIEELKSEISGWESKYKKDMADLKKEAAVDMAIIMAGGRNAKAIKALLDMDKISINDDGGIEGLDIEGLKESDGYLFDLETKELRGTGTPEGGGRKTGPFDGFMAAARAAAGIRS